MVSHRLIVPVLVLTALSGMALTGCEVMSAGGEVVGSAYDALDNAVKAGKEERFSKISEADAVTATRAAANELGLSFVRTVIHPDQQKLIFADDRKQEIVCTLVRRTGKMSEIRVDVGLFGPAGLSRLMIDRIRVHLGELSDTAATRPSVAAEQ